MFRLRPRRDGGITALEITGVLVVLSFAVALATRYALFHPHAADYSPAAQYAADKGEIERQGAGVIAQDEIETPFATTIRVPASTPVVARFTLGGEVYAVYPRARMLTPAVIDKVNLYREAVR